MDDVTAEAAWFTFCDKLSMKPSPFWQNVRLQLLKKVPLIPGLSPQHC